MKKELEDSQNWYAGNKWCGNQQENVSTFKKWCVAFQVVQIRSEASQKTPHFLVKGDLQSKQKQKKGNWTNSVRPWRHIKTQVFGLIYLGRFFLWHSSHFCWGLGFFFLSLPEWILNYFCHWLSLAFGGRQGLATGLETYRKIDARIWVKDSASEVISENRKQSIVISYSL